MRNFGTFRDAMTGLRFLEWAQPHLLKAEPDANTVLLGKDAVLSRYGPLFREHSNELTEQQMGEFLDFDNNCHWTGLHRQKSAICRDMPAVRKAISFLMNAKRGDPALASLFNEADTLVRGFGEGIITPILFVAFPDDFGVWNSKSQFALEILGLWPPMRRGESAGETYYKVNNVLLQTLAFLKKGAMADEMPLDLWTLDYYWHAVKVMSTDGRLEILKTDFASGNVC